METKNEIQKVSHTDIMGKSISVYGTFDEPLFLAKDVAEWIEHTHTTSMLDSIDENEKLNVTILHAGQNREVLMLTEDGLYEVLMQSRKPIAKQFKKQVKQYLKELRKKGFTATPATIEKIIGDPDFVIGLATQLKIERIKNDEIAKENELHKNLIVNQNLQLRQQRPKVQYHDEVLTANNTHTITTIAKELGMSGQALNKLLHRKGIIFFQDGHWVPYSKYQGLGYTRTRTYTYKSIEEDKEVTRSSVSTVWTERGRQFIHQIANNKSVPTRRGNSEN